MLTDWSLQHNRRRKQIAWHLYQRRVLEEAALFHVTSQGEVEALRNLGFDQPAAVVPNGVPLSSQTRENGDDENKRRALFLSRLHPKKGVPMLLRAWADVAPSDWELTLVGPSEAGYRAQLESQVRQRGLGDQVQFLEPVSDEEKWDVYRTADLFVLPTYSENFGIVVAEALASGVPVITTTGTPWRELQEEGCGWWVDPDEENIKGALTDAFRRSEEKLREMGRRGRALVEERYSWERVGRKMVKAYRWVVGEESRPDFIA
jgi:glycosyltransferase involved in cell wall biosynthesis